VSDREARAWSAAQADGETIDSETMHCMQPPMLRSGRTGLLAAVNTREPTSPCKLVRCAALCDRRSLLHRSLRDDALVTRPGAHLCWKLRALPKAGAPLHALESPSISDIELKDCIITFPLFAALRGREEGPVLPSRASSYQTKQTEPNRVTMLLNSLNSLDKGVVGVPRRSVTRVLPESVHTYSRTGVSVVLPHRVKNGVPQI
jgi:hypothetical protein